MSSTYDAILAFLGLQMLCVVSSVNAEGHPESALVAFTETPDLSLIFGTARDSRKYANVQKNPHVSFVIAAGDKEVQFEGIARITTGEEENQSRTKHIQKNPSSAKYAHAPTQAFIVVQPTWIRYTDYGTKPKTIEELSF